MNKHFVVYVGRKKEDAFLRREAPCKYKTFPDSFSYIQSSHSYCLTVLCCGCPGCGRFTVILVLAPFGPTMQFHLQRDWICLCRVFLALLCQCIEQGRDSKATGELHGAPCNLGTATALTAHKWFCNVLERFLSPRIWGDSSDPPFSFFPP